MEIFVYFMHSILPDMKLNEKEYQDFKEKARKLDPIQYKKNKFVILETTESYTPKGIEVTAIVRKLVK